MRQIALFLLFLISLVSCKKEITVTQVPYSEASYKVFITLNWKTPEFAVPAGVHVTPLTGMVHAKDTFLWTSGGVATAGLEKVAEDGNNLQMNAEMDGIILSKKALYKFVIMPPAATGSVETVLSLNSNYSNVSFASMIAPSPDWFMGIHDVDLFAGNQWVIDSTMNIILYDAGTEDGDIFGYDNPSAAPQQKIGLLTPANASVLANGNPTIVPIGTIRFIKN